MSPPRPATANAVATAIVDVSVTRKTSVSGSVTLPAALVPNLRSGDVIRFAFPAYSKPAAPWKWHTDVAFITDAPPTSWLFAGNDRLTDLFSEDGRAPRRAPLPSLVYDRQRGVPIFFLVPEDKTTRGMDGVRTYVAGNGTSFLTMARSSNDVQERQTWFGSFLNGLANGAILPAGSTESSITAAAVQLGASPTDIESCYQANESVTPASAQQSANAACIEGVLQKVQGATPPPSAGAGAFFGVSVTSLAANAYTPVFGALLTVWNLFHHVGHQQYEYVPSVLAYDPPVPGQSLGTEYLRSAIVPQIRGAGGTISDALFFTIGGTDESADRPAIAFDDDKTKFDAVCATGSQAVVPFHLTRTSPYLHDAELLVTGADGKTGEFPVDPLSLGDPSLPLHPGRYHVRMTAKYGFDDVTSASIPQVDIVVAHPSAWSLSADDRSHIGMGGKVDVTLASDAVPCFASATLTQNGTSVTLSAVEKDSTHEKLTIDASHFRQGKATLIVHQQADASGNEPPADRVTIDINPAPPVPAASPMPTVYRDDTAMALAGTRLDEAGTLTLTGLRLSRQSASADGTFACFVTDAPARLDAPAQTPTTIATLNASGPWAPWSFPVRWEPARPQLAVDAEQIIGQDRSLEAPPPPTVLSTQVLDVMMHASGVLDTQTADIRIRRHPAAVSPCDALHDAPGELTLPASSVTRNGDMLDAAFEPATLFRENAWGKFDVQIIDESSGARSDWSTIPAQVIRAPQIDDVSCAAQDATCRMTGQSLLLIAGLSDGHGAFAPISLCPDQPLGSCLVVPRYAHYAIRLKDGEEPLTLSDSAIKVK